MCSADEDDAVPQRCGNGCLTAREGASSARSVTKQDMQHTRTMGPAAQPVGTALPHLDEPQAGIAHAYRRKLLGSMFLFTTEACFKKRRPKFL